MARKSKLKQWEVKARITMDSLVTVTATSEEEALDKFNSGEWDEDYHQDMIDWEATSTPKVSE